MDGDTTSLIGRLVVAAPSLRDPNFAHTVVLLLDHNDEGALGVVLNRPSDLAVSTVLPEWAGRVSDPGVVFVGGPVQPEALIGLGRVDSPSTGAPLPGVGPLDLSADPAVQPVGVEGVRLFAGYAGWTAGQLEGEIESGGWFVVEATVDDAFIAEPASLWRRVLVRQGGVFRTIPSDPSSN